MRNSTKTPCKACNGVACHAYYRANSKRIKAWNKDWRIKNPGNPENVRNLQLQRTYGITLAQYKSLLNSQNGVCAICKKLCATGRALAVDHCHETGHIRGLLCGNCNQAIGKLKDSPANCLVAASYLQQSKQISTPRVDSVRYMSPC